MFVSARSHRKPRSSTRRAFIREVLLVAVCLPVSIASAKYGGGSGTVGDPFLIYTAEELSTIGDNPADWDKKFKLMEDIDLSGYSEANFPLIGGWVGLGSLENQAFRGLFDGNGKAITAFRYRDIHAQCVGLFQYVTGEIKNLHLVGATVSGGTYATGALIGYMEKGGMTDCSATQVNVSGEYRVGGLVGSSDGIIARCFSSGRISGVRYVGGLIGQLGEGTVKSSYSTADVTGEESVGGLVGATMQQLAIVDSCYATGEVKGIQYVGGLAGQVIGGIVNKCYSIGAVSGNGYVGGLAGAQRANGEVMGSLWNIETSSQTTSAGGMGKTTAEMQSYDTYASLSWAFPQVWILWCEGVNYPVLAWQMPVSDLFCPNGVDFRDFAWFALDWGRRDCSAFDDYCYYSDLDRSGAVEYIDLAIFAGDWLVGFDF